MVRRGRGDTWQEVSFNPILETEGNVWNGGRQHSTVPPCSRGGSSSHRGPGKVTAPPDPRLAGLANANQQTVPLRPQREWLQEISKHTLSFQG